MIRKVWKMLLLSAAAALGEALIEAAVDHAKKKLKKKRAAAPRSRFNPRNP